MPVAALFNAQAPATRTESPCPMAGVWALNEVSTIGILFHMNRFVLLSVLLLTGLAKRSVSAADFDLVIRGGRIVDGTGNPWFDGDVGIRGDRIVAIGRVIGTADREIDAAGLIVAPGFIDIHSHSDFLLLEDGHAQSKIRQGVTTEILGEGNSAGPYRGKLLAHSQTVRGTEREWRTLDGYFDVLDDAGCSVNVASYVGLNNVWRSVMGDSFERPTPQQIDEMGDLVDEAMRDGALGLSSQVMMPPGSLATTEDIIALCRVVAKHGGSYSTHIRNEGTGVFESVNEAIEIGRQAHVPVDIIHLKIADQTFWGRMNEIVELIDAARREGLNIQANVYPYTRGNNNLVSIIPPWAHEGGTRKLLERLRDPEQRKRMKHDIENGIDGWYNHYTAVGRDWSRMLISANTTFRGLTMDRVMALRTENRPNADLLDELFDILLDEGGSVSTVYAHHTDTDMTYALRQPWCSVGSDGSAYSIEGPLRRGNPHPRNFGTFPRVLGVYVRELGLLSLEDAVRKMTSLNAARIGLTDRGLLRPRQYADVTVFNPKTVIDNSTYTEPFQYSTGIEYVVVNGKIVLQHGEHTDAMPGHVLRHGQSAVKK
ncbi:amidohydrolase family protein [bacterium]|nr:amidohydrolase family protein [bacterium]